MSIEKCSFPIGKLYFSIEILISYTQNSYFLMFFYSFKIIHFSFLLPEIPPPGPLRALLGSGTAVLESEPRAGEIG